MFFVCVFRALQARRKQLQIGGAHIKSNYRFGGAHIIFFKMIDRPFFFFLGGGGGGHICANYWGGGGHYTFPRIQRESNIFQGGGGSEC